jgi:hypothetical protein
MVWREPKRACVLRDTPLNLEQRGNSTPGSARRPHDNMRGVSRPLVGGPRDPAENENTKVHHTNFFLFYKFPSYNILIF